MLKVAIETWYTTRFAWKDLYGARIFMQKFFAAHAIELVRVSINTFDDKKQCFVEYNTLDADGKNIPIHKKYVPDIIRSRRWTAITHKYDVFKNFLVVPSKKIAIIGNDKFENYKFTKHYQPFTALLSNFFCNETLQKTFTKNIVIKPIRANGGKGILLTTTPELLKKRKKYHWLEELYIVQQFKDFTKWYPWICTGNHDVRFMFAWNKIIEITLRIPKKWDFRSNLWSGWTQKNIQKKQIPKDLLLLSKKIYKTLNLDGKDIFSMDFAYCKKDTQRYLLETNASPWTWYYQTDKKILSGICRGLVTFFQGIHPTKT